jgi:GNAT superfamily N-acetyltransferase
MEPLTFNLLVSSIFRVYNFPVYVFPLTNIKHGWENPYQVYPELYRNEDARLLENFLEGMDIEKFTYALTMEEVDQRIEDGHIFYVAKKCGDIIGYCWYLAGKVRIPDLDATLYLNPDEICTANEYIRPDYRGKGIRNYMRAYECNELLQKGYKRSVLYMEEGNNASLRMHQKWGSVQIGAVKRFNILTLAYHRTNVTNNRVVFHGGPLLLWRKLYRGIRGYETKGKLT